MVSSQSQPRLVAVGLPSWAAFTGRAVEGILRRGQEHDGYRFRDILWSDPDELVRQLVRMRPDGAIVTLNSPVYEQIRERLPPDLPLVNIGADRIEGCPSVGSDDEATLKTAISHMRERGFHRLAWLGWSKSSGSARREVIARRMVKSLDCFHLSWCAAEDPPDSTYDTGFDAWVRSLEPPVGVIAWCGHIATRLRRACEELSLHVPKDVGILSLADEQACLFSDPAISALDPNGEEIGYQAMSVLDRMLDGKKVSTTPIKVKPTGVVTRASTSHGGNREDELESAKLYIETNACAGITVENVVATITSMGRTRFYAAFRESFGCSPAEYIRRVKIERAKELLCGSQLSVTHIAGLCGFGSTTQFGDTFKREVGTTPLVFRRTNLTDKPSAKRRNK
jgi:LacI family transcriptional regulator